MIEGFKRLSDAIQKKNGHFIVQLAHAAATVNDQGVDRLLIAPSDVQLQSIKETPEVMSDSLIQEIVDCYCKSTLNV